MLSATSFLSILVIIAKIEPSTTDRLERLIRSACSTYEQQLFADILQRLPLTTRTLLDELLTRSEVATQGNMRSCARAHTS